MSRTLKWVLGIVAVLVVIAIVAGGVWVLQNRSQIMANVRPNASLPNAQGNPGGPNGQNLPFGPRGFGNNGNRPLNGYGFRTPMMGRGYGFRYGPFGMGLFFLGGFLRLIIPLGLLALVAFVFYQLGKRSGLSASTAPRREPVPAPSEPADSPKA